MFDLERQFIRQLIKHKCGMNSLSLLRYLVQWKFTQRKGWSPLSGRRPWMTFQAAALLNRRITPGCTVFEYGGGGSTLYFLDRGAKVITIENDSEWYERLSAQIKSDGLMEMWLGILALPKAPENVEAKDASDPDMYTSGSATYRNFDFNDYVSTIDNYADLSFDVVVVDGRSRPSCIKHAAEKVKVGGYLLLDNTEREYYLRDKTLHYLEAFEVILDKFGPTPALPEFTKTTVWQKT